MSQAPSPNPNPNEDLSLEELAEDEISEVLTSTEIDTPDGETATLAEVAADLVVGHEEIESYKNGALAYSQYLDEAIVEHEVAENDDIVQILQELKRTAFGIYLRIKRGDDELLGDRDGKYSGYYDDES
ncbi:hypothetical protein HCTV-15_gp59 [Haloarcula virus HCTV-15]|nr:hypothetical protein HCTV-6_gp59 [Haloarcula virus HCTV-6]UBF22533.1 hypothetical protein HCTV-15_gp59 [Haloarcula virus HCTV-15]